jgi:putative ABC transport system substrate-binding protein
MHRREFISLIGGTVALLPGVVRAQQTAMPVIGFLGGETSALWADRVAAFWQGLNETGYVEGRNVEIEYRWAEGHNERLPALAADLVQRQVSVLVALGGTASAKRQGPRQRRFLSYFEWQRILWKRVLLPALTDLAAMSPA